MKNNSSCWIQTYSGKKIYPLEPNPDDICIEDIAHALSNVCRFTGHCREFYSVAQHSVYVSSLVKDEYALWGLLHDASEAYLCDLAKPIKDSIEFRFYKEVEIRLTKAIAYKFELPPLMPKEVDWIDTRMLITEARDLGLLSHDWGLYGVVEPLEMIISPQSPKSAKQSFLDWYDVIQNRKKTNFYKETLWI